MNFIILENLKIIENFVEKKVNNNIKIEKKNDISKYNNLKKENDNELKNNYAIQSNPPTIVKDKVTGIVVLSFKGKGVPSPPPQVNNLVKVSSGKGKRILPPPPPPQVDNLVKVPSGKGKGIHPPPPQVDNLVKVSSGKGKEIPPSHSKFDSLVKFFSGKGKGVPPPPVFPKKHNPAPFRPGFLDAEIKKERKKQDNKPFSKQAEVKVIAFKGIGVPPPPPPPPAPPKL
jgi:hypothetical protein